MSGGDPLAQGSVGVCPGYVYDGFCERQTERSGGRWCASLDALLNEWKTVHECALESARVWGFCCLGMYV